MNASQETSAPHRWQFFRSGGFSQVRIDSADDLRHLETLDQKLWAVLTCPVLGLEFDPRTLSLLDTLGEGRVRVPEVLGAVRWVCQVLRDPQILFEPGDSLALDALQTEDPDGQRLLATARRVLAYLGKPEAAAIAVADFADSSKLFAPGNFNGDGIIPAELSPDAELAAAITLIGACAGTRTDRSACPGIDRAALEAFMQDLQAVLAWHDQAQANAATVLALGEQTAAAVAVFDAVRAKVEDFFTRCQLAAFDARATLALNPADQAYADLAAGCLGSDDSAVAALPLARIGADLDLPLTEGLNPAWQTRLLQLRDQVVTPLLGAQTTLSLAQWRDLCQRLEAWRQWQAGKPATPVAEQDVGVLRALLANDVAQRLSELIDRDEVEDGAATQIEALERLVRLRRDLVTLLRNFVNLSDFYAPDSHAIFQAGTLYLDQRSCTLCLRVNDMARHASLAALSGAYLVYCQCTRNGEPPMTIVAAMTQGDADDMMVPGRNGVFYDRQGRDWHASVTKIVPNPISIRQAFWSPYKRIARMIGEQIHKFAAAQDKQVENKAGAGIADAGKLVAAPAPAAAPAAGTPFDIAKFAGIFAAIGLALGALGTALAAIVSGFLSLEAWKMPLVVLGVVLLISGPSMLLAWLKLRKRNLGPLLDANGWAVNIRARINLPFGASLTGMAQLPPGSRVSLADPYADKPVHWGRWALLALVALVVLVALWRQLH